MIQIPRETKSNYNKIESLGGGTRASSVAIIVDLWVPVERNRAVVEKTSCFGAGEKMIMFPIRWEPDTKGQ